MAGSSTAPLRRPFEANGCVVPATFQATQHLGFDRHKHRSPPLCSDMNNKFSLHPRSIQVNGCKDSMRPIRFGALLRSAHSTDDRISETYLSGAYPYRQTGVPFAGDTRASSP